MTTELESSYKIPEDIHKTLIEGLTEHLGFENAIFYELDDEGRLWAKHGKGIDPKESIYYEGRLPEEGKIMDVAIKEQKEQIVLEPHDDPRCHPLKIKLHNSNPFVAIPIVINNKVVGIISINNKEKEIISHPDKIALVRTYTYSILSIPTKLITAREVELRGTGFYLPNQVPFENIENVVGKLNNASPKIKRMLPKLLSVMKRIITPQYGYFAIDPETGKPTENNADMSVKAIKKALKNASMKIEDIECIILGAPVPDYLIPTTTPFIQEKLGIKECVEFEIHSNCTAMTKALQIGMDALRVGRYKNIVVVYSQNPSSYLLADYYNQEKIEPENLLLRWFLSDCASAAILTGRSGPINSGIKLLDVYNESIGTDMVPGMWLKFGASNMNMKEVLERGDHHFGQNYGMVNEEAPWIGVRGFRKLLKQFKINVEMIDHLIITLPSTKLEAEAKKIFQEELGVPPEKWCHNVREKGYAGGGSLINYLDELIEKGKFKKGELVVCFAVESSKWMVGGFAFRYI